MEHTKTSQLNALFQEWENAVPEYRGKFTRDGIIDEAQYDQAKCKILFIAKEPNDPTQAGGDFREWWNSEGIQYTFSYRISDWSYGLLNNFPPFDCLIENNILPAEYTKTMKILQQIAFMNIKKIGGYGTSKEAELNMALNRDHKFLRKQIDIIAPDIMLLALSKSYLRDILMPEVKWEKSGYDIDIGQYNQATVIDFYHPSSRIAPSAAYSLLQNIVRSEPFQKMVSDKTYGSLWPAKNWFQHSD